MLSSKISSEARQSTNSLNYLENSDSLLNISHSAGSFVERAVKIKASTDFNEKNASCLFVQASHGSFNHQAVNKLFKQKPHNNKKIVFKGSPSNVCKAAVEAYKDNGEIFVALYNSTVSGGVVAATSQALEKYQVEKIHSSVTLPINMSLLRTKRAVNEEVPLKSIASHPTALEQINTWKRDKNLIELKNDEGTAAAAKKLALGEYNDDTGTIGSSALADIYSNLLIVEENIQDKKDNYTMFAHLTIKQRNVAVCSKEAHLSLCKLIEKARKIAF